MAGIQVSAEALMDTARRLVAEGRGLLAMDESNPTCNKRFSAAGFPRPRKRGALIAN
jgi:fructose-bisphosphate aldolase, class I